MKAYAEKLRQWAAWLDSCSLRERILLAIVVLVVAGFAADSLFFHPRAVRNRQLQEEIAGLQTALAELDRQAAAIEARAKEDPNREKRAQQQQLQQELTELDGRLKAMTVDLVPPRDMAEMLRQILVRQQGLTLVSLENLPPEDLLSVSGKKPAGQQGSPITLYRHPVRIVVSGSYLQAMNYLKDLERMPGKLFWDSIEITVGAYPATEIMVTVHTLSREKRWIGV